jgi:hypothetical protein
VSAKEALLGSVSRAASQFCQDANGDGVISLSEGCLAVRGQQAAAGEGGRGGVIDTA